MTDIIGFLSDPALLGPHFEGPSWDRWKAVLRGAYALPLGRRERTLLAGVSGARRPPTRPVGEVVISAGRGGGKDAAASAIAAFEAVRVDPARLRLGERAVVLCLAVDRVQASIAFRYIRAYFEKVPALAFMVERCTDDTIDLSNGASIVVSANNYRSVRGRTICCAILDEVAYWRDENSTNPDIEVDAAITPGLARWPGSKKILISSPYRRAGLLYQKWKESFGKDDDNCLVVQGATRDFNSTFPQAIVDRELKKDPEKARSEYLAEWRDDLVGFLDREAFAACIDRGCYERAPQSGVVYQGFLDPASGRGQDSMVLAIAHRERDGQIVVDCLREARPPFHPENLCREFAGVFKAYRVGKIVKDNWAVGFVDAQFREFQCEPSTLVRSDLYLELLPLMNSGRVRFLDNERMEAQAYGLERRVARSGKDSVNHPDRGHDDVINGVAGAVWLAASKASPIIFTSEMVSRLQAQGYGARNDETLAMLNGMSLNNNRY